VLPEGEDRQGGGFLSKILNSRVLRAIFRDNTVLCLQAAGRPPKVELLLINKQWGSRVGSGRKGGFLGFILRLESFVYT